MKSFEWNTIQSEHWGQCLELKYNNYRLLITLDFGPRIIHFSLQGHQNVFFEDFDNLHHKDNGWRIYGGHRLWLSPESYPVTYDPGLASVAWEITASGAVFRSPVDEATATQKEIELSFGEQGIRVDHRIHNAGTAPIEFAPWALSVMAPGGTAFVPQPEYSEDLLPNRKLILWPYTDLTDSRVHWGKDWISVAQRPVKQAFKFGINLVKPQAAYYNAGVVFLKKFGYDENSVYPDYGCSFELYTNGDFLELETLGPIGTVSPGATVSHVEWWSITPCDNVDDYLKKIPF